jgi:hypothetical protein
MPILSANGMGCVRKDILTNNREHPNSTVQPVSKREYLTNSWNQCKIKKWYIIQKNMKEKLWKTSWFLWKK